jgi:hypothetical protein
MKKVMQEMEMQFLRLTLTHHNNCYWDLIIFLKIRLLVALANEKYCLHVICCFTFSFQQYLAGYLKLGPSILHLTFLSTSAFDQSPFCILGYWKNQHCPWCRAVCNHNLGHKSSIPNSSETDAACMIFLDTDI